MERVRLHANENWYNPMPLIKDALMERIGGLDLQEYPDPDAKNLKRMLADYAGVDMNQLICTNGSDELIKIIYETFSKAGDSIVIHSPTFVEYTIMSELRGCKLCPVSPKEDLTPDIDVLINTAIKENAAITFICNPNNPTGYIFSERDLNRIINEVPGMVIVDEAYCEFSQISLVGKNYNKDKVIIMRTLSKAFGAAALRVGYGIASSSLIQKMNKAKMPYNLSTIAQESAVVLLENKGLLESVIRDIRHERMRVYAELSKLQAAGRSIEVFPSYGNYIMIRTKKARQIYDELSKQGFQVRIFEHDANLNNCLRFSVTQKRTNTMVLDLIGKVVTQQ